MEQSWPSLHWPHTVIRWTQLDAASESSAHPDAKAPSRVSKRPESFCVFSSVYLQPPELTLAF